MTPETQGFYEFDEFRLDAAERVLWRDGTPVALTPKAFETLLSLVERAGHIVSKDELMRRVWHDTFVEEGNIAVNISTLRKALGTRADGSQYIETIARRGYRFACAVTRGANLALTAIAAPPVSESAPDNPANAHRRDDAPTRDALTRDAPGHGDGAHATRTRSYAFAALALIVLSIVAWVALAFKDEIPAGTRGDTASAARRGATTADASGTQNDEAHRAYLTARHHWNKRTPDDLQRARREFTRAIDLDPLYARAYVGLANCYALLSEYNVEPPREAFPKAKTAALRALEIAPDLAEAHTALAYAYANYDWDFAAAEREYKRALELNPTDATAHQWYAEFLTAMRRFDEAQREIKRAGELDPLSLIITSVDGLLAYHARRTHEAIAQLHKARDMNPDFVPTHLYLALAYEQLGKHTDAMRATLDALRLSGVPSEGIKAMRAAYDSHGREGFLRLALAGMDEQAKHSYVSPFDRAFTRARLGERDEVFAWLERSLAERQRYMIYINVDPNFDHLRSDARFKDLLRRTGFRDA
jgi:DNA-binding winged helix-turn-helix (wHTH) protein/tetratricopeptide (TPR) repeat protein